MLGLVTLESSSKLAFVLWHWLFLCYITTNLAFLGCWKTWRGWKALFAYRGVGWAGSHRAPPESWKQCCISYCPSTYWEVLQWGGLRISHAVQFVQIFPTPFWVYGSCDLLSLRCRMVKMKAWRLRPLKRTLFLGQLRSREDLTSNNFFYALVLYE